jgi:NTE family protein
VLSGGGARGAFQVGVWHVLCHDGRGLSQLPSVLSGTSAGAINAALITAGRTPEQMLEFWLDLGRDPPVVANRRLMRDLQRAVTRTLLAEPLRGPRKRLRDLRRLGGLVRKHGAVTTSRTLALATEYVLTDRFGAVSSILERVHTAHLFSTKPLRERLVKAFGGEVIERPRCALAVHAVEVRTGRVVRFVNELPHGHSATDESQYRVGPITVDMVRASAAIPLIFDTVTVAGTELWDGGLLVNTPLAPAVALGARRLIPLLVTAGTDPDPDKPLTLGSGIERLADAFLENAYSADRKLLLERNALAEALPERELAVVELFEAIRPGHVGFDAGSYVYFDEDELYAMYEKGREAGLAWLGRGPVLDQVI